MIRLVNIKNQGGAQPFGPAGLRVTIFSPDAGRWNPAPGEPGGCGAGAPRALAGEWKNGQTGAGDALAGR